MGRKTAALLIAFAFLAGMCVGPTSSEADHYVAPNRFARLFEVDRFDPPTIEEQLRIRNVFRLAEWDGRLDRVLFAVDQAINRAGRRYLPITVVHEPGRPSFGGFTGGVGIVLLPPDGPVPPQYSWDFVLLHEFGHVVCIWLLGGDRSEDCATQFQWWAMNGQNPWHPIWLRLEPVVPETVAVR